MRVNCVGILRLALLLCSCIPVIIIATVPCIYWESVSKVYRKSHKKVLFCSKLVGGWGSAPDPAAGAKCYMPRFPRGPDPLAGIWSSAHAPPPPPPPPPRSQFSRSAPAPVRARVGGVISNYTCTVVCCQILPGFDYR